MSTSPLCRYLLLILGTLAVITSVSADSMQHSPSVTHRFEPRRLAVAHTWAARHVKIVRDSTGKPFEFAVPVSISHYLGTRYFLCNYSNIALLDLATGRARIIHKPHEVDAWYPTAVCYSRVQRRLYVANYAGRNVLVFDVTPTGNLRLAADWRGPQIAGPEGVDVSPDGMRVAVADHDGNRLLMMDASGTVLWSRSIPNCHGVAFRANPTPSVVASGLGDASLRMFTLMGNELLQHSARGWARGQYLWPTTIAVSPGSGQAAVADAHTGVISLIDKRLNVVDTMGGNGFDFSLFNMPYGMRWMDDHTLLVTDTFKDRVVEVDARMHAIRRVFSFGASDDWDASLRGSRVALSANPLELDREASVCGIPIDTHLPPLGFAYSEWTSSQFVPLRFPTLPAPIGGKQFWRITYGALRDNEGDVLRYDTLAQLYSGSYFYFQYARFARIGGARYAVLGSPQAPDVIVLSLESGIAVPVRLSYNVWPFRERLVNGEYSVTVTQVANVAARRIENYEDAATTDPDALHALRTALFGSFDSNAFNEAFRTSFVTGPGKQFAVSVLRDPSARNVAQAIAEYESATRHERLHIFPEVLLLQALDNFVHKRKFNSES